VAELAAAGNVRLLPLDVTDDESVAVAAQQMREEFGRLDVLVNNAGITGTQADVTATDLNGNSGHQSVQRGRTRS